MIVAVSTDMQDTAAAVSSNFGRSRYFVLYDNGDREILQNPYADSLGDAGIQTAQLLIGRNAGAVITGRTGINALRVLSSAGIAVYRCQGRTVSQAVTLFAENKLEKLDEAGLESRRRYRRRQRGRLDRRK